MSLLDSVFGSGAQQAMIGSTTQQQANQAFNQAYNQYQAQQSLSNQFNQVLSNMNQNPYAQHQAQYAGGRYQAQWVFAGKPCTLQEFADAIWGTEDHEDKMLFLLTHSGPKLE